MVGSLLDGWLVDGLVHVVVVVVGGGGSRVVG